MPHSSRSKIFFNSATLTYNQKTPYATKLPKITIKKDKLEE